MKLQKELEYVTKQFEKIATQIPAYADKLKKSKEYNDFETRLAWDCLRTVVPSETICSWYDKYDCTDAHITTLAKTALKSVYGGELHE